MHSTWTGTTLEPARHASQAGMRVPAYMAASAAPSKQEERESKPADVMQLPKRSNKRWRSATSSLKAVSIHLPRSRSDLHVGIHRGGSGIGPDQA